jgi:hypothetical protein
MNQDLPKVISRYLTAAADMDLETVAACFTDSGTVVDEDHTYRGREEIVRWREQTARQFNYTATVIGNEKLGENQYRITAHIVGNFPGGEVDLHYDFTLQGDLIEFLTIVG